MNEKMYVYLFISPLIASLCSFSSTVLEVTDPNLNCPLLNNVWEILHLLKLSMSWELNSEEEAEELMQITYTNPLILTVKVLLR